MRRLAWLGSAALFSLLGACTFATPQRAQLPPPAWPAPQQMAVAPAPPAPPVDPQAELQRRCNLGDANRCAQLAEEADLEGNLARAAKLRAAALYLVSCQAGEPSGCGSIGYLYLAGKGVQHNLAVGAHYLMSACDGGDAHSCANLGTLYFKGMGLRRSAEHGAKLFEKACAAASPHGCNALASAHYHGVGAPRDRHRAAKLFEQACQQGSADACSGLGAMTAKGVAVERDDARAANLFKRACDRGSSHGCGQLGLLSLRGNAEQPANPNQAMQLFMRACRGGDAGSCMQLSSLLDQKPDRRLDLPDDATVHGSECSHPGDCAPAESEAKTKPVRNLEALLRRCARGSAVACSTLGTSGKVSDPGF